MHSAPPVVYPVGRCAFQGWVFAVLGGLSASVGSLFLIESDVQSQGLWGWITCSAGILAWLVWMAWAFLSWNRSPEGALHWSPGGGQGMGDASSWSWTDRASAEPLVLSDVERVLDLQGRVLLRVAGPGLGQRWLWVEQSGYPERWRDLRRALVSSRA